MYIKVEIRKDRMGNIIACPVRDDIRNKIRSHLQDFNVHSDGTAFFQEGGPAQEFLENELSKHAQREIAKGHTVTPVFDPWIVGHWYGWDTHTLFE